MTAGKTVIIDYDSGNLHSAEKAFARAARAVGGSVVVTDDPEIVRRADRVVLPGVGAFGDCAAGLRAVPGMVDALDEAVRRGGAPFFGICVGMQLMAERGLEHGEFDGLGWLKGEVAAIRPSDPGLKVPHMGWNAFSALPQPQHPALATLALGRHVYFVHSFHLTGGDPADLAGLVDYGGPITALVARDNLIGAQFHPEKSQAVGQSLIEAFLRWRPEGVGARSAAQ